MSGLFRAWGACESLAVGVETLAAENGVPDRTERVVFSLLIPASVIGAAAVFLNRWLPWTLALPAAFPVALLLMHAVPLLWRLRKPWHHWWAALAGMLVWSAFHRASPLAWLWFAIGILEISGWAWLGFLYLWRRSNVFRFFLLACCLALSMLLGAKIGWLVGFMAVNGFAVLFCWGTLRPRCPWFGPLVTETNSAEILLTIDDGPDEDTAAILDLLDAHQTKAVFFLIGEKASRSPDLVREIHRRGHAIGNHTMTHPQATFWAAGPWRTAREIRACQAALTEITGEPPRYFRAPVGHRTLFTHPVTRAFGLEVMAWSCRGYDGVENDPQTVLSRLLPGIKPGAIVLLHQGRPASLEILRGVLKQRALILAQAADPRE